MQKLRCAACGVNFSQVEDEVALIWPKKVIYSTEKLRFVAHEVIVEKYLHFFLKIYRKTFAYVRKKLYLCSAIQKQARTDPETHIINQLTIKNTLQIMAKIFYLLKQNNIKNSKVKGKWFAHGKTVEVLNTRKMANHISEHGEAGGAAKKEDFSPSKNLKGLHIRFLPDQMAETNISSREFIKKAEFVNAEAFAGALVEDEPSNGGSGSGSGSSSSQSGNTGGNQGGNTSGGDNTGGGNSGGDNGGSGGMVID